MTNPHGHQYPQQPGGYSHYGSGPHGYQHGGPQQGPQPGQPFAQPSPYHSMPQNDRSKTGCLAGFLVIFTALLPIVLGIISILVIVGAVFFAIMVSESGETSSTTTSSSVTATSTAVTPTASTTRPTAPGGDSSFEPPEPSGSPGYIR